jgi:hypothetical protein
MGGRNNVIPDHTLDKEAIEQYLTGGFNVEAIVYQVIRWTDTLGMLKSEPNGAANAISVICMPHAHYKQHRRRLVCSALPPPLSVRHTKC